MQTYQNITDLPNLPNCVIALGNFDGVHIGHQELIKNALNESRETGKEFILISFSPNPNRFFNPNFRYIHNSDLRYKTFENLGIQHCLELNFDQEFSQNSPLDFVQLLHDNLKPSKIITGYNFTFGHKKQGNRETLKDLSTKFDFIYQPIEEIKYNSKIVSSSYIRTLIANGRVKLASKLLSSLFTLSGEVKKGEGNATKLLNAPTANIDIDFDMIIKPLDGVYLVRIMHGDTELFGLANIGHRPTFYGKNAQLEVHILDFDKDLYNEYLEISLISLLRIERKFDSTTHLKEQIERDINAAKYLIRNLSSLHSTFE